ncbi:MULTISPECIES: amino acid permease [unclassified Desulfovibrio]|uniref:amino acid permease n=1 Tax=unclassified Desulfovibrio TaxID=2593640 RepID=UPI0013ECAFE4|nr:MULTISPECIES: amino acid permease [unclassified Desulfovibrio]
MAQETKKLGTVALAAVVVSSMIGGGIYSLPQNMAADASLCAIFIAWVITGVGMFGIANSFRILADVRPDLSAGIYMYARVGFGPFVGFLICWAYWLCQICGNVGYAVITMDALNYFFPPYFQGGNNIPSIIGGSLLIWVFNFIVLRGTRQAAFINTIGTVGKIIPLFLFIIIVAFCFHIDKFDFDFFGNMLIDGKTLGSMGSQVKSTMLVTLWCFIGIEGAVVLSARAKSAKVVGSATILGYLGCLAVYVLLSVLPFGFMTQHELAAVPNPSTAGVLEHVVGPWGAWLMNIGLLIAVLTSWLAWTMITAEMPFAAAKNGTFPKMFASENKHGSPNVSLWITSGCMQLGMLLVYFSNNAWNTMLNITGVMVLPAYVVSMMYLWKICEDGKYPGNAATGRASALINSIVAVAFGLWLIYAAGLSYLLMATIIVACGIPFYIWARKQNAATDKGPMFSGADWAILILLLIAAVLAIYLMARGTISGA